MAVEGTRMTLPPPLVLGGRRSQKITVGVLAIALSLYLAKLLPPTGPLINWNGFPQLWAFVQASLTPDLSRDFLAVIGRATLITLAYAICGTTISLGFGFVGGVLASKLWWNTVLPPGANGSQLGLPLWRLVRVLFAIPRAIHELIWGLLLLNIVGMDPVVGVVAIAIPFSAIVAKVFSEIFDETPTAPLQALVNSGVPPAAAWLYGLLPQALPNLLSYATYRFECSLRAAAVLGIIGAGGLGQELYLSLQSLRYPQLWTGFYALILLNGTVDYWSAWIRQQMGFTSRLDLNARVRLPSNRKTRLGSNWGLRVTAFILAIALPLAFNCLGIDWAKLWSPRSHQMLCTFIQAAIPSWPSLMTGQQLFHLSSLTLAMSILAALVAGVGGILLSFTAARMHLPSGRGVLGPMSRLLLLLCRAIPAPIWALVFLYVLFPGILPGALALAVHNMGILGRLMAETNENLDEQPLRSLVALGASTGQVILYGVLPQNLGRFMAYIFYRWEVCLRETVIVGLVGAGGLGRLMMEQISSFNASELMLTLGCFVLLTLFADWGSQQLRTQSI